MVVAGKISLYLLIDCVMMQFCTDGIVEDYTVTRYENHYWWRIPNTLKFRPHVRGAATTFVSPFIFSVSFILMQQATLIGTHGFSVDGTTRLLGHPVYRTTCFIWPLLNGPDSQTCAKFHVGKIRITGQSALYCLSYLSYSFGYFLGRLYFHLIRLYSSLRPQLLGSDANASHNH